jgi:hypothetical protein
MARTCRSATLALVSTFIANAPALWAQANLPSGWVRAGSQPQDYEMGTDPSGGRSGGSAGFIKAKTADARGFGTLMQMFDAAESRGKRLRFSAYVKSAGVEKWTGLWMRVDGPPSSPSRAPAMLAFDNMQSRPIKGTADWKEYQVVLDVPEEAQAIGFGILLEGSGQAWMDDLRLEPVGLDVPVTSPTRALPAKPNLRFDH